MVYLINRFLIGTVSTILGAGLCALGVNCKIHSLLFLGCFFVGLQQGLGQFFRFTAVEMFPKHIQSKSVTIILSGGIIGALAGPSIARWSIDLFNTHCKYEGCFFLLGMVGVFNLVVLFNVKFPAKSVQGYKSAAGQLHPNRPLAEVISQPKLILSVSVATIAHSVMVMLMSNCIISMEDDGFNFQAISIALQLHFLAMFVPGLFTGKLIETIGATKVALLGCLVFVLSR
jgi:MFS family permease